MSPGEQLRKVRETLGLSREQMAEWLDGFTGSRLYDLESGRTKMTPRIASQISYTFGLNYRFLMEATGEMMIDAQHLKNLEAELFSRGILSREEREMIEVLREYRIGTAAELRSLLASVFEMRRVAEGLQKYDPNKK